MKKTILISVILLIFHIGRISAQTDKAGAESFGKTLNLGLGIGYYGYVGHSTPVININYEFDVAKDFTLAPFITFYAYRNSYYYGNPRDGYKYYYYRSTVIPIGGKGTYYFDRLFKANSDWDFYLAGSLGFAIVSSRWDSGYPGDRHVFNDANPLFLDIHVGSEYHINKKLGIYLDLSTGISTLGLAIHH
jgi:hypothetical protein